MKKIASVTLFLLAVFGILALILFVIASCTITTNVEDSAFTTQGWAHHYAKEYYKEEYPDKTMIGVIITEYTRYDVTIEGMEKNQEWRMYKFTFVDDQGGNITIDVFIAYEYLFYQKKFFKQDRIIEIDIQEVRP